eukprot:SAG22_NODE_14117_length_384_cov_0.603509_1_plen_111_part_01
MAEQGKVLRRRMAAERALRGQLGGARAETKALGRSVARIEQALRAAEQEGAQLATAVAAQQTDLRAARHKAKKQEAALGRRDARLAELGCKLRALEEAVAADQAADTQLQE